MAYEFAPASSQHLTTASSPVSGYPLTLAAWCMVDDLNTDRIILAVNQSTTPFHRITIFRSAFNEFRAQSFGSSNAAAAGSASSTGTWFHIAGVFASATSRIVYVNGIVAATDTSSSTINTLDEIIVGGRRATGGTVGLFWDGKVADAGIWNAALTADEIASLADGMTCDKVRPQSLVFYAPLVRDLIDYKGGLTITNNNTATIANHPRVYA
jgi:hypothetical protein